MSTQQNVFSHQQVNAHGTPVRQITVYSPERVTELSYQFVMGQWVQYKRIVHSVH
ncbi:hypothetical protein [Microbulbifer sp. THAF38]|uniref:hypothetical protein n=1 Tax=Microbulbifer sp. THAF38 TaxID=2587856 RepID=UPI0012A9DF95|nr:hypothetical protein [Microbulbifer sp. THAF38]QFT57109.1 hypothetical protein FIU95_21390 [Microbulbifer sp. THAF38]